MNSYEERLPLIDKAIDYYKGKLPREANPDATLIIRSFGSYYFISEEYFNTCGIESEFVCYEGEFEQRAKELGWVNGYKWDVEYETKGKKPDLPDDVTVSYRAGMYSGVTDVETVNWDRANSFRIIDSRYKPKGGSVSEIPAPVLERVDRLRTKAEENQRIEDNQKEQVVNNNWYEEGELPPVGTVCELIWCGVPQGDVEIIAYRNNDSKVIFWHFGRDNVLAAGITTAEFRPIRTETDKLVDEALETLKSDYATHLSFSDLDLKMCAEVMIEAGYRKVKPMSRDECISKIFGLTDNIGMVDAATLYDAGCRFIDKGE